MVRTLLIGFESGPGTLIRLSPPGIRVTASRIDWRSAVARRRCGLRDACRSRKRGWSRQWAIHGAGAYRLVVDGAGRLIDRRCFVLARARGQIKLHPAFIAVLAAVYIVSPAVVAPGHEVGSPAALSPRGK